MKSWPPSTPDSKSFNGAFIPLRDEIREMLRDEPMSEIDASIARYMHSSNIGIRLRKEEEGTYDGQLVVRFETVTRRKIRKNLLRVFRASSDEDGVFVVPTRVTHAAMNELFVDQARILANEIVGGFYEQFQIAEVMGVSPEQLGEIDPDSHEEELRRIYDEIRTRTLKVIEG